MKIREAVEGDWLSELDGKTVQDAINYLETLPKDYELAYWQSAGDDQGVEFASGLVNCREATPAEEAAQKEKSRQVKIIRCEARVQHYQRMLSLAKNPVAAATYRRWLERAEEDLKAAHG
jgi:hypothetical protein